MKNLCTAAALFLGMALASPASAALAVGALAPDFSARGSQGGTAMTVGLAELLKQGPVVVFFLPYVFNSGSAAECREFANTVDIFHAAGAAVVGMSRDPPDALERFSTEECVGKVPMVWAGPEIVNGYDVNDSANFATRTTYVIAPTGKIAFVHDDDDFSGHARNALAFVQAMKR